MVKQNYKEFDYISHKFSKHVLIHGLPEQITLWGVNSNYTVSGVSLIKLALCEQREYLRCKKCSAKDHLRCNSTNSRPKTPIPGVSATGINFHPPVFYKKTRRAPSPTLQFYHLSQVLLEFRQLIPSLTPVSILCLPIDVSHYLLIEGHLSGYKLNTLTAIWIIL